MGQVGGKQKCLHCEGGICAGENAMSPLPAAKMSPLTIRRTARLPRARSSGSSSRMRLKHHSRKFESDRVSRLARLFSFASVRSLMAIEVFFFLSDSHMVVKITNFYRSLSTYLSDEATR